MTWAPSKRKSVYAQLLLPSHESLSSSWKSLFVLSSSLQQGRPLAPLLEGKVPAAEHMLIAAGEQSGEVQQALREAWTVCDAQSKARAAVVSGLLGVVALALGVTGLMGVAWFL